MTTATASPTHRPYPALSFSLSRVLRQAFTALAFILLIAGYSSSHPASYRTSSPQSAAPTTFVTKR